MRFILACGLALVIAASSAGAQAVTGSLQGSVLASTADPLSGVDVTVHGPALQGERHVITDARGRFVFLALPAGTYTVVLRHIGYAPLRIIELEVRLGAASTLDHLRLTPTAVQLDEIVTTGARAALDLTTTAHGTTLDSARIRVLPGSRDYLSLLTLAPAGNPSPYGDGTAFGGATGYDNKYFIDGIHASNPLSSDGSIRLPYNFIREVQVVTGGYEAEYGRSQAAVVNVVTNSGGNQFHGEAVAFYTGNRLRATPQWGIQERPVDHYSHYDIGLSLGGPIQRDRMWFYAAYNPLFEDKDVSFTGIPTERDHLVRHLFAGKLTWRPAPATDLTLTVLGDPTTRDAVEGAEAWTAPLPTVTDPRVVRGGYRDGGWVGALQLRQQLGRKLLFTASASRLTNVHQVGHRTGETDPASLARIDDNPLLESSGDYGRFYRVNTSRTAGEATLTLLASRHTVKLGANVEYNAIHIPNFTESFITHNQDDTWSWFNSHWAGHGHSAVPAVYAQDSWEISQRLRANFGLRWEGQFVAGDTGRGMTISDEFSPRLGLVFQPGILGSQKLFASAGRYYEQLPLWSVSALTMPFNMLFGTGYPQNPLQGRDGGSEFEVRLGSIAAAARDLHGQYYDEVTAGYERRLGSAYRIGLRGTLRMLRWALESRSVPADPENPSYGILGLLGNPGRGALADLPKGTRRYTGLELSFERTSGRLQYLLSYVLSRAYGNLNGEFDSDSRVPATHTQGQTAASTWWEHATGYLPSDRRHLVKLTGSYRLLPVFTIGMAIFFGTGLPLSEFGVAPDGVGIVHVRDRGTNGRTPSIWNVDVRLGYDAPAVGRNWRPRIVLDLSNVGNQRRAIDFDQFHYTDDGRVNTNPNYLKVNKYQAPLSARIGLMIGF